MLSNTTFFLSGLAIVMLLLAKIWQAKNRRALLLFNLISRGDQRVRDLSHTFADKYNYIKEKLAFTAKKQLPLYSKNLYYKFSSYLKDKVREKIGDIRNSRLLKKSDGLSEFFKNIKQIEKGNGKIDEVFDEIDQDK